MANPVKSLTPQERYELCYILESRNWHSLVEKLGLKNYPMQEPTKPFSPQIAENTEGVVIDWTFIAVVLFLGVTAYHMLTK